MGNQTLGTFMVMFGALACTKCLHKCAMVMAHQHQSFDLSAHKWQTVLSGEAQYGNFSGE